MATGPPRAHASAQSATTPAKTAKISQTKGLRFLAFASSRRMVVTTKPSQGRKRHAPANPKSPLYPQQDKRWTRADTMPTLAPPVSKSIGTRAMDHEHTISDNGPLASVLARIDRPVVLVGMMGVGKSSLGRRLAAQLGVEFLDADEEIEKAARLTIPEIFASYGEAFFRDGERRVIARLLGVADTGTGPSAAGLALPPLSCANPSVKVIATGGGAFINDQTRALILSRGIAVWLDADLDTLVERTARKDNRPLLKQGNPREILSQLKTSREPFYAQAPIKVMSANMPHARTLTGLMGARSDWLDTHLSAKD